MLTYSWVFSGARSLSNSYTMGCLPVRDDNPRAFSEWIILRTGGQIWYNYFMPPT